jgi:hypothetical protein
MKLQELNEAHDPSTVAHWINSIFTQSKDPDWQHIEAREWISEITRQFPDMTPTFAQAVASYIYNWTSAEKESVPTLPEIKEKLYRFTAET